MTADALAVIQSTSPLYARQSFWCVVTHAGRASDFNATPYHALVPSFGEWGFVLAGAARLLGRRPVIRSKRAS
jgi:spermidine synthase